MQQSLIEANKERAILIAQLCAYRMDRVGRGGAWHGYHPSEGLEGILVKDDLLRYARPGTSDPDFACLFFFDPKLTDIKRVDWGEPVSVQKDVIERYTAKIDKIKGVAYDDTLTHEFSKTTTLQQAFKIGAELAIKAFFKASYSGVEGGAEVSAKLTAEYSRQWGESETHTDTVSRHLALPAAFDTPITYEAIRSVDKMQRQITATANMDYQVSFVSGPNIAPEFHPYFEHNWGSVAELISVGKGFAAADKAMYGEFMDLKLASDEIQQIQKLGEQTVEFQVDYDNVNSQEIHIRAV